MMKEIWVREGVLEKLSEIDSVVLDIDGVIVWVGESFRQAISQGVQFYLTKIRGWSGEKLAIELQETEFFKQAGGFNNDWDLALAVVMLYLHKSSQFQVTDLEQLTKLGCSIEEYTYHLAQEGGGLASVEKVLGAKISAELEETIATICKEFYGGEEFYEELYGGKLRYVPGSKSLIHQEEILLDTNKLLALNKKLAIVTGRNWREAKLVLEKVGLLKHLPRQLILTDDDGLRKPDPRTLNTIAERLGTKVGIYIGDTLDDLRTTKGTAVPFLAASVLTGAGGPEGAKLFREKGAHVIAPEINSLLDFLGERGNK